MPPAGFGTFKVRSTSSGVALNNFMVFPIAFVEGLAATGQVRQAALPIDEALEQSERNEKRYFVAELLRIKGELLLMEGTQLGATAAEDCFVHALDVAREQSAPSWELRAATSLARLWRDRGRTTEARELLSRVYDQFTEGFETADLKTAQTLLGQLA
jgi:predicted ATPase